MHKIFFTLCAVAVFSLCCSAQVHELPERDSIAISHVVLQREGAIYNRQARSPYQTIIRAILNSHKFVDLLQNIPDSVLQTLENDADEAKDFVTQIENGQVPDIIKNLPQEVIDGFTDVLNIIKTLPTQILNVAEAAVTDVEKVVSQIEDGTIVSEIEKLPSEVASVVTKGWGEFTGGIVCFFNPGGCHGQPSTTAPPDPSTLAPGSAVITPNTSARATLPAASFRNSTSSPTRGKTSSTVPSATPVGTSNASIRTASVSYESLGVWASTFIMIGVLGFSVLL